METNNKSEIKFIDEVNILTNMLKHDKREKPRNSHCSTIIQGYTKSRTRKENYKIFESY